MQIFKEIISNEFLIVPVIAWAVSQIVKMIIAAVKDRTFSIKQITKEGGMPSAHSATVASLMVVIGFFEGFDSAAFAAAFILCAIVLRDATGVRLETGKQSKVIKTLADAAEKNDGIETGADKLKLGGGHTSLEVFAGCAVGILVAIAYILIFA